MEGHASISPEILASYAADAALEVSGVTGLTGGRPLSGRRGVRVLQEDGRVSVELHLAVAWGVSLPDVARAVQERVGGYLTRMADIEDVGVDVVVSEVGEPGGG